MFVLQGHSQNYRGQQREVVAYNLLINGIISGVGGAINRSKEEKFIPVFFKNFGKGCVGGLIKYSAKSQTYYLNNPQNAFFAPINRLYFFLGQSIVNNASLNKKMLDSYSCNFYGIAWRFKILEKENRFQARLSMATLYNVLDFAYYKNKLDIIKSLEYGQFYFDMYPLPIVNGEITLGYSQYNVFAIRKKGTRPYPNVVSHEIVHTYQHYDLFCISNFYEPKLERFYKNKKIYKSLAKFIYLDYEAAFFSAAYLLQPKPEHYKNFYEFEAEHFNSRNFVKR